jgi:acyl-CoA reductase-like NAD-dependent aldehyde dehydrogenase
MNADITQKNRLTAQALIDDLSQPVLSHFIDGQNYVRKDSATISNRSPFDDSELNQTALGTEADVNMASLSSEKAFESWRQWPADRRRDVLHAIADRIEDNA